MLTQHLPLYVPPTGYYLLCEPNLVQDGTAWYQWDCLTKLSLSAWMATLRQYGITRLEYRGYESVQLSDMAARMAANLAPDTIVVVMTNQPPRDPNGPNVGQYGIPGGWLAYHYYVPNRGPYAICPVRLDLWPYPTSLVTHEIVEALMDSPPGSGWWNDAAGDEAADECQEITYQGYVVASYWDNSTGGCFGGSGNISFE